LAESALALAWVDSKSTSGVILIFNYNLDGI
jgi:hypothetical protein